MAKKTYNEKKREPFPAIATEEKPWVIACETSFFLFFVHPTDTPPFLPPRCGDGMEEYKSF